MIFNLNCRGKDGRWKECSWHKWFAWYPVCKGNKIIWLQVIYRRLCIPCIGSSGDWEYSLEKKVEEEI